MQTIQHTDGPSPFNHVSFNGLSRRGDTHDVADESVEYLCDDLGYFERTGEIALTEEEYSVEDAGDFGDKTYDELVELARDADIDGRSSMDKAELKEALRE